MAELKKEHQNCAEVTDEDRTCRRLNVTATLYLSSREEEREEETKGERKRNRDAAQTRASANRHKRFDS